MFKFSANTPVPKCFFTHGQLSRNFHPQQAPLKKQPLSTISAYSWFHAVDVILPKKLYEAIWPQVESKIQNVTYQRVIMSLGEVLEGDFFNVCIKTGNISMLSEGRPGIDNLFSIKEGILRLELPKEKYELAGLTGHPIADGTRKHIKTRFAIEINLRLPSMVRGRKGFERLLRACEVVLVESVTWLFSDPDATTREDPTPISKHHPQTFTSTPEVHKHLGILIPPMKAPQKPPPPGSHSDHVPHVPLSDADEEDSIELLEWLGLVALQSPRINAGDVVDPYISRYSVPSASDDGICRDKDDLISLRWKGFLRADWVRDLFVSFWIASQKHGDAWLSLSGAAFRTQAVEGKDGFTILRLPPPKPAEGDKVEESASRVDYLLWEMVNGLDDRI